MSSAKILVILEGEQPEGNTLARLQRAFPDELADLSEDLVKIVYTSNIYALYNALKEDDEFLDVVEVLKERFPSNDSLQNIQRDEVSQIFLFFDLDIHGTSLEDSCKQLSELLEFFDNETENGKLFLSYPMVESINICDSTTGLMSDDRKFFKIEDCRDGGFKNFVNDLNRDSKTICRANSRDNWTKICKFNYEKAQWLKNCCSDNLETALKGMAQPSIFESQKKFMLGEGTIATLSAFPFFFLEYLGVQKTVEVLHLKELP